MNLPGGPFGTVYADPPWPSSKGKVNAGWAHRTKVTRPYDTMRAEDILSMPVGEIAAPDALLVLWATWMHLPLAVRTIEAWGFQYATGCPWLKVTKSTGEPIYGPGMWFRHCTELLLIGRRGKPFGSKGNPRPAKKGLIQHPRGAHSEKPQEVALWIQEKFPGPWVELFARNKRQGWTTWGDEV